MSEKANEKTSVISVIMPVYNSEQYLRAAIESVINQTFSDWELLLIDDGSKDNSGEICDEYAGKDKRIKVVHQENKGICGARNTGMQLAKGAWIGFIDNDDIFMNTLFATLIPVIKEEKYDVIKYGYKVEETFMNLPTDFRDNVSREKIYIYPEKTAELLQIATESGYFNGIWNGIYKREFLIKNKIYFEEKLKAGYEDWIFNCRIYPISDCQLILPYIGYLHYERHQQSTSKKYNENQPYAALQALEAEEKMYQDIQVHTGIILSRGNLLAKYIIELILIFHRDGCSLSSKEKIIWLKALSDIKISREKNEKDILSKPRRILLYLYDKKLYSVIFYISNLYISYIEYNRNKKNKR